MRTWAPRRSKRRQSLRLTRVPSALPSAAFPPPYHPEDGPSPTTDPPLPPDPPAAGWHSTASSAYCGTPTPYCPPFFPHGYTHRSSRRGYPLLFFPRPWPSAPHTAADMCPPPDPSSIFQTTGSPGTPFLSVPQKYPLYPACQSLPSDRASDNKCPPAPRSFWHTLPHVLFPDSPSCAPSLFQNHGSNYKKRAIKSLSKNRPVFQIFSPDFPITAILILHMTSQKSRRTAPSRNRPAAILSLSCAPHRQLL